MALHAEAPVTLFSGTIDNKNPFVEFPVIIPQSSTTIHLELTRTEGDFDPLLYLVDQNGIIIAQNDDRAEDVKDSALTVAHLTAGNYRVIATRYKVAKGKGSGTFELNMNILPDTDLTNFNYDVSDSALAAAGYPAITPHNVADWTILAYYAADNDLEGAILNDFDEFEVAGGSSDHIRVVVLLDRSPEDSDSNGDWTDVRVFEVQRDETGDHITEYPPTIDTAPLADLGELDSSDGLTLAQFLVWGVKTYPAQHYAIAIGSHGAGWRGLAVDYTSQHEDDVEYSIVTLPELREALTLAKQAAGVEKFDLMINDACLMSSVEYHTVMTPFFHLTLASPEIVVNPALDMTRLTSALEAATQADAEQLTTLGTELIDQYILKDIYARKSGPTEFYTNALTNLDEYKPVTNSVEAFARLVVSNPNIYIETLGRARSNTYTYTNFLGETDLVDVGNFMEQVIIASNDVKLMGAAQNVLEAMNDVRLHGNAGEEAARWSYYYNIYFPAKAKKFDARYADETPLPNWNHMLQTYFSLMSDNVWNETDSVNVYHPASEPRVRITQVYPAVSSPANPPTIRMEVEGRRIARGNFTVDVVQPDGERVRLLNTLILTEIVIGDTVNYVNQWRSGVDQSSFSWMPMTLTSVSDGSTTAHELLLKSGNLAILEGRVRESAEEEWRDVAVMFSLETHKVARVMNRASGTGALAEITPKEGAEFQTYRQVVASDGETKSEPGTVYRWSDALTWAEVPAPGGIYELGFLVETYSGLSGFDSVRVTVHTDDPATTPLGYSALDLGITFEYPQGWITPFENDGFIITNARSGRQRFMLTYSETKRDNPWKISENYEIQYGLAPRGQDRMIDFNGQKAVTFAYEYRSGGLSWYGRALAFYRQAADKTGLAIVMSAETRREAERDSLYDSLINHTTLFDAAALSTQDDSTWQYRFLLPDIAHPIPITWNTDPTIATGRWAVFFSQETPQTTASMTYFDTKNEVSVFERLAKELPAGQQRRLDYQNSFRKWRILEYRTGGDAPRLGRLYMTTIDERVFALKFETPDDDSAIGFVRNVFEPMVDGFAPLNNVQYALGGINPVTLKAVMSRALLACDEIDLNEACYGEGSVVVEAVTTASGAKFVDTGDMIDIPILKALGVGISEHLKNTFDSLSIAVMDTPIPAAETRNQSVTAVRMGVFGGVVITQPIEPETEGNDQ